MQTVLVTFDVPTFDKNFHANLTTFLTYFNRHHAYKGIDNQTKAYGRIQWTYSNYIINDAFQRTNNNYFII